MRSTGSGSLFISKNERFVSLLFYSCTAGGTMIAHNASSAGRGRAECVRVLLRIPL